MTVDLGFNGELTCAMQCTDMGKSIEWFENVLGFTVIYRLDDMGWCEMQTPTKKTSIGLSQVEKPEVRGGATLTFGVSDIDAARSDLEAKDVRFDGETMTIPEMVKLATFFDPDGNKFMLSEALASAV